MKDQLTLKLKTLLDTTSIDTQYHFKRLVESEVNAAVLRRTKNRLQAAEELEKAFDIYIALKLYDLHKEIMKHE